MQTAKKEYTNSASQVIKARSQTVAAKTRPGKRRYAAGPREASPTASESQKPSEIRREIQTSSDVSDIAWARDCAPLPADSVALSSVVDPWIRGSLSPALRNLLDHGRDRIARLRAEGFLHMRHLPLWSVPLLLYREKAVPKVRCSEHPCPACWAS